MTLNVSEAFNVLQIPEGSNRGLIKAAYKDIVINCRAEVYINSEALKKFQEASVAYKVAVMDEDDLTMSMAEMLHLYDFHVNQIGQPLFWDECVVCSSDTEATIDHLNDARGAFINEKWQMYSFMFGDCFNPFAHDFRCPKTHCSLHNPKPKEPVLKHTIITAEQREKNAKELISEEQKEKKKLEKRRAQKKRRREKKKLEKQEQQALQDGNAAKNSSDSSTSDDEGSIDTAAAFIQEAIAKKKLSGLTNGAIASASKGSNGSSVVNTPKGSKASNGSSVANTPKGSKGSNGPLNASVPKGINAAKNDKNVAVPSVKLKAPPAEGVEKFPKSASSNGHFEKREMGLPPPKSAKQVTSPTLTLGKATTSKKEQKQAVASKPGKTIVGGPGYQMVNSNVQPQDVLQLMRIKAGISPEESSRCLAMQGNERAKSGLFNEAIAYFSEAIMLNPKEYRYFGNRSYCYERLQKYDKALQDADDAIRMAPDWAKGYYRRAQALIGMERYMESLIAFTKVLELDPDCSDAAIEMAKVHELILNNYGAVGTNTVSLMNDDCRGDAEVFWGEGSSYNCGFTSAETQPTALDRRMDPQNPDGITSLWIGNVTNHVTDYTLQSLFQRFGAITSIRYMPDKHCAFVNYKDKDCASKAMRGLQGYDLMGQNLLIRFPDHAAPAATPISQTGTIVLRKHATHTSAKK